MSTYPEHEKLAAVKDESQAQGEFMGWLEDKGMFICRHMEGHHFPQPVGTPLVDLLAEYHGIDQKVIEQEKRQMLAEMRVGK